MKSSVRKEEQKFTNEKRDNRKINKVKMLLGKDK